MCYPGRPVSAKTCRVSFKDVDGICHQAGVHADSLYEAAALGLKALKKSDWIDVIGPGTRIDIQVLQPLVEHFMMYAQLLSSTAERRIPRTR